MAPRNWYCCCPILQRRKVRLTEGEQDNIDGMCWHNQDFQSKSLEALEDRFPSTNVSLAPGVKTLLLMLN